MLQTVKKGSSLHVVGGWTVRIGEAARPGTPRNRRERPPHKAVRADDRSRGHGRHRVGGASGRRPKPRRPAPVRAPGQVRQPSIPSRTCGTIATPAARLRPMRARAARQPARGPLDA